MRKEVLVSWLVGWLVVSKSARARGAFGSFREAVTSKRRIERCELLVVITYSHTVKLQYVVRISFHCEAYSHEYVVMNRL
jgi:hypothetical protein